MNKLIVFLLGGLIALIFFRFANPLSLNWFIKVSPLLFFVGVALSVIWVFLSIGIDK